MTTFDGNIAIVRCEIEYNLIEFKEKLVGARGFEPPTSCSQSRRAARLRHAPMILRGLMMRVFITL